MPADESGAAAAASSVRAVLANTNPWPGSVTPQPKPASEKRENAIAFVTGSGPETRLTVPSLRSSLTTASEITSSGPST